MVKPIRKNGLHLRFVDSKKQRVMSVFNRNVLILLLVFLAALAVTFGKPFDLHNNVMHGHALWFLLLPAYPLLGLLGIVNAIFDLDRFAAVRFFVESNPALGLAILDMITLGIVWLVIRRRGLRWFGASGVQAAANFVLILYAWGIFQLMLTGVTILANENARHQHCGEPTAAVENAKP